jgi:hypothetical protein
MSNLTTELLEQERKLWDANLAGDGAFYAEALRDDALAVSPWGVLDKDAAVAGVNANRIPYVGYRLADAVALPLGADAAVLTYRAEVDGTNEGTPFTHTVYATSAYVREDGSWRSAFHQQTLTAQ